MTTPTLRPRRLAAALVLAAALGVAACGDGSDDEQPAASATTTAPSGSAATSPDSGDPGANATKVKVALFRFQPSTLEVTAGTTVTWRNDDAILHTVTAGVPGEPAGDFDEQLADKGATASVKFDKPGTYQYFCDRHPEAMKGEITVT